MSSSQNLPSIHCLRIYICWYFSIKSSKNCSEDSFISTIRLELFLSYKTKLLQLILLIYSFLVKRIWITLALFLFPLD